MSNIENRDESAELSTESTPETIESSERRSFIKSTVMVASAAAVGGLAASAASAAGSPRDDQDALQGPIAAVARAPVGMMHVIFNRGTTLPTLADLTDALGKILRPTGCFNCGLVGLDIRFGLDTIFNIDSKIPVNVNLEGTLPQR